MRDIIDFMDHEAAPWFKGDSWSAWRACLKGSFALPMDDAEFCTFQAATGRTKPLAVPASEIWACVGRRGGKDRIASLVAVHLACYRDYKPLLAPGEVAVIAVTAADRRQARIAFRYIRALLTDIPSLARFITRETDDTIELGDLRVSIEVTTCSFRTVRGHSFAACVNDEIAWWQIEGSANPDVEILAAQRPALSTLGGLMVNISSPFARKGSLHEAFEAHYGRDDSEDVLFWKAPSRSLDSDAVQMNPTISRATVERAYERDPDGAAAEWGAEFRSGDAEQLFTVALLDSITDFNRPEILPPDWEEAEEIAS